MRISPTPCVVAALCLMTTSSLAWAQPAEPDCPPGSWFCEETPPAEPPPELPPPTPTPPPSQPPAGGTTVIVPGAQPTPPVVVYQQAPPPPPPAVVVVRRAPGYVPSPPPPPKKRTRLRKWGFNMRLTGVLMDDKQDELAGMGGVGFSLRLRPQRYFAVDLGLDMLGGRDYEGNRRSETPFSISALLYANPRDATQFYMLAGIGWSHARVETDDQYGTMEDYDYFGGHMGAGLEFRLSPPLALNIDLLGFVRGRTDRLADSEPEFTDPETGQTTNSSGGGLLRAGLTFYW